MKPTISELIRPSVLRLKPYSSARDDFKGKTDGMVFIDANENPFGSGLNRYPDPRQTSLRKAIGSHKGIDPSYILLGNGSDEVLDLIVRVFCEPGSDKVVTLPPTYGMYEVIAGINDIGIVRINLDNHFQPDLKAIAEVNDERCKILFLCSPNNPSGNALSVEKVEAILKSFKGIVVIDEAYSDFSKTDSWTTRLTEYPNLIVTQTLSKAYGLAAIRLGICYADPQIIEALNRIKPPYNVNSLTQEAALLKLHNIDGVRKEVKRILEERRRLSESLKKSPIVKKIWPSDANFLLVRVDNADKRYEDLLDMKIVVRNRSNLPGCENCLRFTVGTEEENNKLLEAINKLK